MYFLHRSPRSRSAARRALRALSRFSAIGRKKASRGAAPAPAPAPTAARTLIFLDIDGVLAPFGGHDPPPRPEIKEIFATFAPACVARLAALVAASGAEIVLSSSWRASPAAVRAISERFEAYGPPLSAAVAAMTDPKRHEPRQWEIFRWLEKHRLVDASWVALDDEDLVEGAENRRNRDLFAEKSVLIASDIGFDDDDLARALAILGYEPG